MKISSVVANNSIKLLSGLANNDDSLTAMVIKDWIGDGATVYTYKKNGGKDDAREKTIEEFGTGAIWLFGIPLIKKIIEKTAYPLLKLDANFDPRVLDNAKFNQLKQLASGKEKELFNSLNEKNPIIKSLTNAQMYKGMGVAKFAIATILSGIALTKIIKYKQKTTTDRIAKDKKSKQQNFTSASALVQNSVNKNKTFESFTSSKKTYQPSFTGAFNVAEFMYNPIKNTMILDGVIAGTRLKEARKEERFEVLFKELCQVGFIYGLAKPIQLGFEKIGEKLKTPIKLDPKTLFMDNLDENIKASKESIESLKNSKDIIADLAKMDVKSPIMQLLANEGVINLTKDNSALSFLKPIDENDVKKALSNIENMGKNIENLKGSKTFKVFAVVANVLIAAGIMGVIQPKVNILLRKLMYGTNENPAIAKQEKEALNA